MITNVHVVAEVFDEGRETCSISLASFLGKKYYCSSLILTNLAVSFSDYLGPALHKGNQWGLLGSLFHTGDQWGPLSSHHTGNELDAYAWSRV